MSVAQQLLASDEVSCSELDHHLREIEDRVAGIPIADEDGELPVQLKLARIYRYYDLYHGYRHNRAMEDYDLELGTSREGFWRKQYLLVCHDAIEYWLQTHRTKDVKNLFRDLREMEGA